MHARFCYICGAARSVNGTARPPGSAQTNGHAPEILAIDLWRGYVTAEFVATVANGKRSFEVARSPSFPCRGSSGPAEDNPRALAAFEALVEELDGQGWTPVERRGEWYSHRFRRRADAVPDIGGDLSLRATDRIEPDRPEREREQ